MHSRLKHSVSRFKRIHFRWRVLLFSLLVFGIVVVFLQIRRRAKAHDWRYCFMDPVLHNNFNESISQRKLEDILLADIKPTAGQNIFFHETTCSLTHNGKSEHLKTINLNARQACAIESAALHNPNLNIFVLFATPTYWDKELEPRMPLIDSITSYKNVHLRNLNLWTYAAGTTMYNWLREGEIFNSDYVVSHVSDFLRYLTLWRWGGTYLDMDTIMLRSIETLNPNYAGVESDTSIAAGIINFDYKDFGLQLANDCLENFKDNFKGSHWGTNGPGVITRVLKNICKTNQIESMIQKEECEGFKIYNRTAFYEINYEEWEKFFEDKYLDEVLSRTRNSYLIHVWNRFSMKQALSVGSKAAYAVLAERNCPKVYASAGFYL